MSICNKSCFESAIMLDCIYKVDSDILETIRCDYFSIVELCYTCVLENLVFMYLSYLKVHCILPMCVAIFLVKSHSIIVILLDLETMLISSLCSDLADPRLLDSSDESFGSLGISFEVFPSCCVKKIMFLGINCPSYWIIFGYEC